MDTHDRIKRLKPGKLILVESHKIGKAKPLPEVCVFEEYQVNTNLKKHQLQFTALQRQDATKERKLTFFEQNIRNIKLL
jgi:hypothetical protein